MKKELVDAFKVLDEAHDHVMKIMLTIDEDPPADDLKELADTAFCMREVQEKLKSMEGVSKRLKKKVENIACLILVSLPPNDPRSKAGNIKTPWVTATPSLKMAAHIPSPKKNPEEYALLMDHLGIEKEVWSTGIAQIHWPKFVDHVSTLTEQGRALPPGLDVTKTYPVYSLLLRRKQSPLTK